MSGRPVLSTHREETDTRRCVRCQGEHRWLALPHPEDHLCAVCRRECPGCQAPTSDGERCRACRDRCRTCAGPLPQRPEYASGITHVEPGKRKDRRRKWARTYFPRSWDRDQCDACQTAASAKDPLRAVLAALPDKLVLACGGGVPPASSTSSTTSCSGIPPPGSRPASSGAGGGAGPVVRSGATVTRAATATGPTTSRCGC
ncbi:hypothetical protein [Streptomyces albofaciens]|uniref:hypothetical protein n=1 Tax=Streptomyces albofaciens TaxID=66866 RepID=UPI001FCBA7CF|nr:hypothetical protein [Streptomyces albofaciens]